VAQPVSDAEGAKLGKITVVEDQDEVACLFAQAGERVWIAARKVPDVAGIEVVDFRAAARIHECRADTAFQDEGPFRGGRTPVKFPRHTGLQAHRYAGDTFGNRQFFDSRFLAVAAAQDLALGLLQGEFERRQFLAGEERIGDVVLERKLRGVAGLAHRWVPLR
jgi:hypothetical protein